MKDFVFTNWKIPFSSFYPGNALRSDKIKNASLSFKVCRALAAVSYFLLQRLYRI